MNTIELQKELIKKLKELLSTILVKGYTNLVLHDKIRSEIVSLEEQLKNQNEQSKDCDCGNPSGWRLACLDCGGTQYDGHDSPKDKLEKKTVAEILSKYKIISVSGYNEVEIIYENIHKAMEEFALQEKTEVTDEEKEAVSFILENPDGDDYTNNNYQQYLDHSGEATDNSIEVHSYWRKQQDIVIKFLKRINEKN